MRKYIHTTVVAFVLLTVTATSCKKSFLEVVPKGKLVAKDYEDYNLLMNGPSFYKFGNTGMWQAAMIMGDEVSAEEAFLGANSAQSRALFQYDDAIFLPSNVESATSENPQFLQRYLQNLYTLNKIINEVNSANGGTQQQRQEIAAEAMVTRAYTNFQLINYFAKPYAAATAASDPGFPIITTEDITETDFKRGTVQEMYDFIIRDLTLALPAINTSPSFRTRWCKASAEGFLGKVYLFMGNATGALEQFNASFADLTKMSSAPHLYNYNETFGPGGSFLPLDPVFGPNSPFNNQTDYTESVVAAFSYAGNYDGNGFGNDFLSIKPEAKALFGASDLRLNFFTDLFPDQSTIPGGRVRRFTSPYSSYARIGLELPELYLLRAEAKARTSDLSGAVSDVETLRKNRMPATDAAVPIAIAADKNALIKFILEERIREYAGLGYRWWDLRRLSVDPIFSGTPLPSHTLFLTNGGTTQFNLKPERLTLRIPAAYIKAHPEMTDNP
ncbi:RagB/SusD family nutrient uptake outer membrane protein [Pedobacter psychroterrae]|uniref:RagB/SusD family nutrient uptake outer membrane protein n=1 Tax=Pedobacter psychroterrae TaxID=2530453 RepID=A0A4R0NJR2_9SPHI|nr:RagB/SusD family nutrient uptake outer membrane protein [Pedobacter psychroterrae]TCD00960.1 RagB/SusD family nutrient uptake outer membrane protein [Pedobacter psychroterrae]